MNMAGVMGEQLLKGFDMLLGIDDGRQKNRIVKLLQMETAP